MSNPIVSFDEQAVKDELRELVRKTIEETIIEMYLAGVSTRRIEDVGEILWGAGVSAGTVSNLNDKAFKAVDEWRCRPLAREYPYVYIDGIYLKRSWGGSYENAAVMAAIGVNEDGYREVIGCAEGFTESSECWRDFLSWLKSRGLRGVRMFVGDKAAGMVGSTAGVFPGAKIPALHRALLPQRPRQGSEIEEAAGGGHAQGDPRDGVLRGGRRQGRGRGRRPGIDAAEGGRQGRARGLRRDADVLRDAPRALAAHPHEQRDRVPEQGNTPAHPRGQHVPRREIRADAGGRQAEIHSRKRVGPQALPRRIAARREGGQDVGR